MSKRLAITISGAVSLGSFEAGVLYEIIHAIGQHNQNPDTPAERRLFIDVLTGASAGGMSATIAAQKLLFERNSLDGPYSNALYSPWVIDADLESLLAMHGQDDPSQSIFSSQSVIDISKRYLTARYENGPSPAPIRHSACAARLHLGLALANLNGVDYGLALRPAGQFIYTRHQDQLAVRLDAMNAQDDALAVWDPLRNAAVSCGAFPFAFRVIEVQRQAADYTNPAPITPLTGACAFAYTDGGTFQNEPLGLAKNLVDQIDGHLDVDNRFYLFIAHGPKTSTASGSFNAGQANFRNTALRLAGSIFDQARFQDWVTAEAVNSQVALFNRRAEQLRDWLREPLPEANQRAAVLQHAASALLPGLFSTESPVRNGRAPETLDQARARLRAQFLSDYNRLPATTRDVWIDSILTLEKAASLASRDEMTIFGITAGQNELAGAELCAFAGFFDRRYRDHDYDLGRQKAQQFLQQETSFGPIQYTPETIRPIDTALNGLKLEQMDRPLREQVRDRLRVRLREMIKEAGLNPWLIGGVVRGAIDLVFIKPELEKLLGL